MDILTALINGDLARRVWELQRENERLRTLAGGLDPLTKDMLAATQYVRYAPAGAVTAEQREACPARLYAAGDCVLVWANEGDLCIRGVQMK